MNLIRIACLLVIPHLKAFDSSCAEKLSAPASIHLDLSINPFFNPTDFSPGEGYSPYFFHNQGGISNVSATTHLKTGNKVLHHRAKLPSKKTIVEHESAILFAANSDGSKSFLPKSYGIVELSTREKVPEREFIEGIPLNQALGDLIHNPQLSIEEKLTTFMELTYYAAQSLNDFHELGFLHGDYRPANIILRKDWQTTNLSPTVIIDFSQSIQRDPTSRAVLLQPLRAAFVASFLAPEILIDPHTAFYFETDEKLLSQAALNFTRSNDFYYFAKSLQHIFQDLSGPPLEKGWPLSAKRKRYYMLRDAIRLIESSYFGELTRRDFTQRPQDGLGFTMQIQNQLLEILSN